MNARKLMAVTAICVATALPALAGTGKSISINFAGPRDSPTNPGDSAFSTVSGSALFGALPVAGDNWNNFQTHSSTHGSGVASASSIKLNDGTVAAGVSASWNASCTYSVSASSTTDRQASAHSMCVNAVRRSASIPVPRNRSSSRPARLRHSRLAEV